MGPMLPAYVKTGSAVVLLAVLGYALLRRPGAVEEPAPAGVQTTLLVRGMTCSHCQNNVRRVLLECPGVEAAEVDLNSGRAVVSGDAPNLETLVEAVERLGYSASVERA